MDFIKNIIEKYYLDRSLVLGNDDIVIPVNVYTYRPIITRDSYTQSVGVSFRVAKGVRIGQGRSRRVTTEKISYGREVFDGEILVNQNSIYLVSNYHHYPIYVNNPNFLAQLRLFLFGGLVFKDIPDDSTLIVKFPFKYSVILRSVIYQGMQRGLKVKKLNVARKWWFLGLSLIPVVNSFWFHRLMSNGWRDWLIIVTVIWTIIGVGNYFIP